MEYAEIILDHYRDPQNYGMLPSATHRAEVVNSTCGDRIIMSLEITHGVVNDITFSGSGCAISTASASLLTEKIKGMTQRDVEKMDTDAMRDLLNIEISPARLKCALIPLEAVHAALNAPIT